MNIAWRAEPSLIARQSDALCVDSCAVDSSDSEINKNVDCVMRLKIL